MTTVDRKSRDLEAELDRYLDPGEQPRWVGWPPRGLLLRPMDAFLIPFALFWCGFVAVWEIGVLQTDVGLFMSLWGLMFVLIGLYLLFGRFIVDAYRRRRTLYALTGRRALILSGVWRRSLRSIDLATLSEVRFTEGRHGRGTISFGREIPAPWAGSAELPAYGQPAPSFEAIDDAAEVFRLIRTLQRGSAIETG
jgi:hypothetical protein